ncbi:hypothetical protein ACFX19_046532 [Malus domestica]
MAGYIFKNMHPPCNSNRGQHSSPSRSHHPLTWFLPEPRFGVHLLLGSRLVAELARNRDPERRRKLERGVLLHIN